MLPSEEQPKPEPKEEESESQTSTTKEKPEHKDENEDSGKRKRKKEKAKYQTRWRRTNWRTISINIPRSRKTEDENLKEENIPQHQYDNDDKLIEYGDIHIHGDDAAQKRQWEFCSKMMMKMIMKKHNKKNSGIENEKKEKNSIMKMKTLKKKIMKKKYNILKKKNQSQKILLEKLVAGISSNLKGRCSDVNKERSSDDRNSKNIRQKRIYDDNENKDNDGFQVNTHEENEIINEEEREDPTESYKKLVRRLVKAMSLLRLTLLYKKQNEVKRHKKKENKERSVKYK